MIVVLRFALLFPCEVKSEHRNGDWQQISSTKPNDALPHPRNYAPLTTQANKSPQLAHSPAKTTPATVHLHQLNPLIPIVLPMRSRRKLTSLNNAIAPTAKNTKTMEIPNTMPASTSPRSLRRPTMPRKKRMTRITRPAARQTSGRRKPVREPLAGWMVDSGERAGGGRMAP